MKYIHLFCTFQRFVVLSLMGTALCFAQLAQLNGRVTDDSGAVIQDVKITVTNADTGVARDTTTNNLGYYTVGLLRPGNYKISASKPGFQTRQQSGVVLQVDQNATLDFLMQV